jgi:hypothetical protein
VAAVELFICQCLQMLVASIPAFFSAGIVLATGIIAIKTPVSKRKSDTKTEPSSKDPSLQLGDTPPLIGEQEKTWSNKKITTRRSSGSKLLQQSQSKQFTPAIKLADNQFHAKKTLTNRSLSQSKHL